jgi:hypothetical protein
MFNAVAVIIVALAAVQGFSPIKNFRSTAAKVFHEEEKQHDFELIF